MPEFCDNNNELNYRFIFIYLNMALFQNVIDFNPSSGKILLALYYSYHPLKIKEMYFI